ncbi:MAG: PadR family transcriptional regulator [Pseudomonadota bacterium]|nr:PadR family transcriptional regulator [Pseudomonadota bacterium]
MNVSTLCLGILWFGEATGYEIKKQASEGHFSHFMEASYGSIYPALSRLNKSGHVTLREASQEGKPDRKIYSITDKGRAAFLETLHGRLPSNDTCKSEFLFHCLYAEFLHGRHVDASVNSRLDFLREGLDRLRDMHERCDHAGSRFAIGYGIAVHEAAIRYIEQHKALVQGPALTPAAAE